LTLTGSGWKPNRPVDLLRCPKSQFTGHPMGEFTPMKLVSIFERIFGGFSW
jgi:hypothetical protein